MKLLGLALLMTLGINALAHLANPPRVHADSFALINNCYCDLYGRKWCKNIYGNWVASGGC